MGKMNYVIFQCNDHEILYDIAVPEDEFSYLGDTITDMCNNGNEYEAQCLCNKCGSFLRAISYSTFQCPGCKQVSIDQEDVLDYNTTTSIDFDVVSDEELDEFFNDDEDDDDEDDDEEDPDFDMYDEDDD